MHFLFDQPSGLNKKNTEIAISDVSAVISPTELLCSGRGTAP